MSSITVKNIIDAAQGYLKGKTVRDLVIGVSWIGCQLDDDSVGVACALRDGFSCGFNACKVALEVIGRRAEDAALFLLKGDDNIVRAIGASVLCAASQGVGGIRDDNDRRRFGINFSKEDTVGMVGYIPPVAEYLDGRVGRLIVFDEGLSLSGEKEKVLPMKRQSELLSLCDKVIITGSAIINGSMDGLLEMCKIATDIAIVGTSTPMFPEGWALTKATRLAGSWWENTEKAEIFRMISLAGGIARMKPYMRPKIVAVTKNENV